jgi:Leucine-rich repeat (LRR) protein
MPFLKKIYINDNQLEEIPLSITKISELIVLDISGNSINKKCINKYLHICDLQKLLQFEVDYGSEIDDLEWLIKIRLVYRLFFILNKSILRKINNYKIIKKLINY